MSAYDRTRRGDLASFFRSLANPSSFLPSPTYDSPRPSSSSPGTTQLDFFDQGLIGATGAETVLRAIEKNPGVVSLSLSQNNLGDEGVRIWLAGMKQLRSRGYGNALRELTLSGNGLTDTSLHLITLHLLLDSPHPPTLTHLYLTGNSISIATPALSSFLGTTLSSPLCRLECLSLTGNPLRSRGLLSLLSRLTLPRASSLSQLHLSGCRLTPDCVEPLARWLEDPDRGGTRIQVIGLNGNRIGIAGVRRIARTVIEGRCTGLLHLETLANKFDVGSQIEDEDEDEEPDLDMERGWEEVNRELEKEEMGDGAVSNEEWNDKLGAALRRNKVAYKETRLAALRILPKARVLFGGNPTEGGIDIDAIRRGVEDLNRPSTLASPSATPSFYNNLFTSPTATPTTTPFPFLRLPIEIQINILRCTLLHHPSTVSHLYPSLSPTSSSAPAVKPSPSTSTSPILTSALTELQFLHLLSHASSSVTLSSEIKISMRKQVSEEEGDKWEDYMLRATGCDRFER